MANTCFQNVFVGSETGLLKGIYLEKNAWSNVNTVEKVDKENEIVCMCWGSDDESMVSFGTKSRLIQTYNRDTGEWRDNAECPGGEGKLCGLSIHENQFITAVESGLVKVWRENSDDESTTEINAGENLSKMSQNKEQRHLVATGGKDNDLKLWDITQPKEPVFKAKNVRNDWLNLRVPVWVLGIEFLPESGKIVTCTGHRQIRIYDPSSSQRRPVLNMEFDEYPLTAISLTPNHQQVVVGNTQGKMDLMDLRKGEMVQSYKGFAGGIRSLQCHPTMPLVASCGLDRFLRVHDINSSTLLHKIYLKSRLNCLLFGTKWSQDTNEETGDGKNMTVSKGHLVEEDSFVDSGNEDDIWSTLETVKTKTIKKRKMDNESVIEDQNLTLEKKLPKMKSQITKKVKNKNKT